MTSLSLIFQAQVADIRLESRSGSTSRWQIALTHTLFSDAAPTGTLTALAPSGARLEVVVLAVREHHGIIWHTVDKPLSDGTEVTGRLTEFFA